jgi:hypothetical protein
VAENKEQRAGREEPKTKRQLREKFNGATFWALFRESKPQNPVLRSTPTQAEGSEVEVSEIENGVSGRLTAKDNIDACEN